MRLCLLSGISGLAKRSICENKLVPYLSSAPEKLSGTRALRVGTGDVEDELLDLFAEDPRIRGFKQDPLAVLIGQFPPDQIRDRWGEAYKNAVEKATKNNPDIAIVRACLEYYRFRTYEYFCPVDMEAIRKEGYRPGRILTLIDDVYDVYYRLSQEREVFAVGEIVHRKISSLEPPIAPDDLPALYKEAISVVVECLQRVLVWREKELAAAVNIGRAMRATPSALAVKHPIETGARLLLGDWAAQLGCERSYPVYVAHPISRPRRARQKSGEWPSFVGELNSFASGLRAACVDGVAVVPVMPTAIDEFRLREDGGYIQPALAARWRFSLDQVMFCLPNAPPGEAEFEDYEDYERRGLGRIFDPPVAPTGRRVGVLFQDPEVSGVLRALKESIRLQMAGRDHFLVRQCPGLFLYRPVYDEGEFSDGVAAEVETFAETRKYEKDSRGGPGRRVVFIHDVVDADEFFRLHVRPGGGYRPSPVDTVALRLARKGEELAREAGVDVTVQAADLAHVADALKVYGDPREKMQPILNDLIPERRPSAISSPASLSRDNMTPGLTEALVEARARVLAGDLTGGTCYLFSEDTVRFRYPPGTDVSCENYVEVMRGSQESRDRAARGAERVRHFLVTGTPSSQDSPRS